MAAPYWGDIDNRNLGEIWYETHSAEQSSVSDSYLERVSMLVRSELRVSSFQGTWMLVATWNGSVPFAGTGTEVSSPSFNDTLVLGLFISKEQLVYKSEQAYDFVL